MVTEAPSLVFSPSPRPGPPGVKVTRVSPLLAPQVTFFLKRPSASRAIQIRSRRVYSRKRWMRPLAAAALASAEAPDGSSTSGTVPTTTIWSPSMVTSGAPVNQPSGSLPANQPAIVEASAFSMITKLPPFAKPKRRTFGRTLRTAVRAYWKHGTRTVIWIASAPRRFRSDGRRPRFPEAVRLVRRVAPPGLRGHAREAGYPSLWPLRAARRPERVRGWAARGPRLPEPGRAAGRDRRDGCGDRDGPPLEGLLLLERRLRVSAFDPGHHARAVDHRTGAIFAGRAAQAEPA